MKNPNIAYPNRNCNLVNKIQLGLEIQLLINRSPINGILNAMIGDIARSQSINISDVKLVHGNMVLNDAAFENFDYGSLTNIRYTVVRAVDGGNSDPIYYANSNSERHFMLTTKGLAVLPRVLAGAPGNVYIKATAGDTGRRVEYFLVGT